MEATGALDRDAVRRVLNRASELADGDPSDVPDVDVIDPEALIEAAGEVGIPEDAVRRAMAIERLGTPPGRHGVLLGPAVVVVDEELPGSADAALAGIDRWLVGGHHMRRDRLRPQTATWTRRRGILGTAFRSLRHATGEGYLGDLERIDAVALDTGTGSCVVRVIADRRRDRRHRGVAGAAVGTAATAGAVVGAVALGPWLLLAAPATVAVGTGIAVTGRRRARRVEGEIDRVLDSVEQGARPVRLGPDIARRMAPALSRRGAAAPPGEVDRLS
jgi:hypothetical protein